jgi:hypothetical protein
VFRPYYRAGNYCAVSQDGPGEVVAGSSGFQGAAGSP